MAATLTISRSNLALTDLVIGVDPSSGYTLDPALSLAEVAEILGVNRHRADRATRRPGFPPQAGRPGGWPAVAARRRRAVALASCGDAGDLTNRPTGGAARAD